MLITEIEHINEEDLDSTAFEQILTPALDQLDKVFKQNKFEIRIVGGAVRDIALNKVPKDIDLATDATPDEMIELFDKNNIRYKPTGLQHGTVTVIMDGEPYEITTLRADVDTDGRHAEVEFIRNWEEDAQRRDLTYNAMSLDFDGQLYDYFNGMDDLQDKVSKFVGDADQRIKEDYLRILRYFRFQSKLENPTWDKETLVAVKSNAKGLTQISVERIWQELAKLLVGTSVVDSLAYMNKTGVDSVLGIKTADAKKLNNYNTDNPVIALAVLGNDTTLAKKWKLSRAEAYELKFYVTYKDKKVSKEQVEHMVIDGMEKDLVVNLLKIQKQDKLASHIEQFDIPTFPVTGNDLIQHDVVKPGPEMGNVLNKLKDLWKQSNYTASKDELLNVTV
jgi:tRNA nucleotidyltransferase (CCA-adding enzyme)